MAIYRYYKFTLCVSICALAISGILLRSNRYSTKIKTKGRLIVQNVPVIVQPVRTTVNQATQFRQRGYNISEWMSDRYKPPLASETPNGTLGDFFSIVPPPYPRNFINITEYDLTNFTFVTSSSSNHFNESLDMVAGVQHHFPDKKLIYYDLGLTSNQRKQVASWCNVILRNFDFERYPPHVKTLTTFGFKPAVVWDVVQEFGGVFYMDTCVRHPTVKRDWTLLYKILRENGGIAVLTEAGHTIHKATHDSMYKYLPSNTEKLKTAMMHQGGIFFMYNTRFVYENILHWWYMCAMTADCTMPAGNKRSCKFKAYSGTAVCHRHDQSSLSILTSNVYGYDPDRYVPKPKIVDFARGPSSKYKLRVCSHA